MTEIQENIKSINTILEGTSGKLVAISKTKPDEMILEAYATGQRDFGENKVQELVRKHEALPKDIRWHLVGHLQRNKVKQIAPLVHLIHSADSVRLLETIHQEGAKINRIINCLLQVHIAMETTKFGFDASELKDLFDQDLGSKYPFAKVVGLMGMATFTEDEAQIRREFSGLKTLFDTVSKKNNLTELSMGMSGDYQLALEYGSTIVRVGSSIFGERNYPT